VSLMTQAWLLEKYGARINMDQLAEILDRKVRTIYNQLSAETFPVKTYLDGQRRFADYRDVAEHLDHCRERAAAGANSLV
jgi:hypothetical protein